MWTCQAGEEEGGVHKGISISAVTGSHAGSEATMKAENNEKLIWMSSSQRNIGLEKIAGRVGGPYRITVVRRARQLVMRSALKLVHLLADQVARSDDITASALTADTARDTEDVPEAVGHRLLKVPACNMSFRSGSITLAILLFSTTHANPDSPTRM